MIHERVDLAIWKTLFSLQSTCRRIHNAEQKRWQADPSMYTDTASFERAVAQKMPRPGMVTSPCDLAFTEQFRDAVLSGPDSVQIEQTPADVFVFSLGEPSRRDVTKIGGLPYWPDSEEWPRDACGKPMTFIAQLCFADSLDIAGRLPGDVLLVFGDPDAVCTGDDQAVVFRWQPMGLANLVGSDALPASETSIVPCYGAIHRTYDFTDPYVLGDEWIGVGSIAGTKIGGVPHWILQPKAMPGRYLAAIGSIQPAYDDLFPWLNVPEATPSLCEHHGQKFLKWGDMGILYLFLDEAGMIHWTVQGCE